jgi:hypothetical protein
MALVISTTKATHRAGTQWVDGDPVYPIVSATGATGVVNWTDTGAGGTFQLLSNTSAIYLPADRTQQVTVTGVDTGAGGSGSTTIQVTATFPLQPTRGYETQLDRDTKLHRARGGTRYFREDYDTEVALNLSMDTRSRDETLALRDFWNFHRKITPFYYLDVETGMLNLVRFESAISYKFDGAAAWDLSVAVRGDYQNAVEPQPAPTTLRINCGGYVAAGEWIEDAFFVDGDRFYFGPVTVDSSALTAPIPPDEALRWCRYSPTNFTYLVTGLKALQNYQIRLIFCANVTRTIHETVQGAGVNNVVIPAAYVATQDVFTRASDAVGHMSIRIEQVSGVNALLSTLELLEV